MWIACWRLRLNPLARSKLVAVTEFLSRLQNWHPAGIRGPALVSNALCFTASGFGCVFGWFGPGPASCVCLATGSPTPDRVSRVSCFVASPSHNDLMRRFSECHRRVARPRRRMAFAFPLVKGVPHLPDLPRMREAYTKIRVGESPRQPPRLARARLPSTSVKRVASSVNGLLVAGRLPSKLRRIAVAFTRRFSVNTKG